MLELRQEWRAAGHDRPIASKVARSICAQMTSMGYKMPNFRQVQRWLTQQG